MKEEIAVLSVDRLQILDPDPGWSVGPQWLRTALAEFRRDLLNPGYPCTFGRHALRAGDMHMTWVAHDDLSTLPGDLTAFVDRVSPEPERRQPLIVFVEPSPRMTTAADYDRRFWEILEYLHLHDDRPWPADVPADPDDPGWQFCFHGTSLFVFALAPSNRLRRSRRHPSCLVLSFQPRTVFDGIGVGTPAGNVTRTRIRDRLRRWDLVGRHPSMGEFDEMSDDEWRQYFITDDDADLHDRCPFRR
ncbi:YqcI/YcgG family protein [Nonomuraea sp. FMUSA5-5]|uniref:YqcI/YcgG family protein n=1 Tax=Nonomuraea composti TaxID=2720023 RepID=A0ABX1BF26_9ACTN|nr:YqcI/YcgG family protein [Nonomuraea sp. FMUSA5-5]NJP96266.1 YqcI/YcgG family protein [Nonomuraea sp. FMUSA5-5]